MDVPPIHSNDQAADIPPEDLLSNKQMSQDEKLGEIARQFEALLLRQILADTQKTVIPSEFADNSTAASIYQGLATEQLANSISKSGTLGLAKLLQTQLTRQLPPASTAGHDCTPEAQPTSRPGPGVARPSSSPGTRPSQALHLTTPTKFPMPTSHE